MSDNTANHIKEILITLDECGIDFIVCGGIALVLQGVERFTMDIDLSVDLNETNLKKFIDAMHALKLKPRAPVPAISLLDPEIRKMFIEEKNALVFTFFDPDNPFRQVDMFIPDSLSFEALKHEIDIITIDNHPIKVLNRQKLLELKESISPPREKDIFDIQMLKKVIKAEKTSE
ncbi:MAG: hypothetical protein WCQ99_15315 [Pseudomonadota bacterium]